MCCNTMGSAFCLGTSAFCVVYCMFLAWMISIDYDFLGEWKSTGLIPATDEEKTIGANNCYTVAGIYGGLCVISAVGVVWNRSRGK